MKDFMRRFRGDWQFLLVSIATTVIGINFLVNPNLLEDRSAYAFIVNALDDAVFAVPIAIFGFIGVVLFVFNKRQFRSAALVFYQFIWMILLSAYFYRAIIGYPNSTWIMALAINIMIFLIALWGDDDGR
ncbi:hypothetical protein P7H00_11285 [Enterococcus pseudoavium]|uniref:Uncharacterized protein n=1 Tax=Enterococcus pseudoavium TaxID=44007 RepID=A0AAE4I2J9_9ENTE|nr:hypothetical protein [Enterococcus pseudoavium]MDT2737693.1 hypothetical protein [Enterococcus pseudoavium]